ncbi:L domain-like protein [Tilletiaria anomala UBC 951]|uniref:L domain-like protein n=1 Tax=Tilletiaria anomala (strain ATCC 24038 / CBS 436.72 / UBC 951) TaxID=1037660 RepID=A0A066WFE4_TILAU|nr:L domain-like protein [Tilletiaria anomala UBC 951]KDN52501.1 L domain-like protein [Tilletiaria anomala UBC 951]
MTDDHTNVDAPAAGPSEPSQPHAIDHNISSSSSLKPRQKVQIIGDLPPAPRFSADQLAEAAAAKRNGDQSDDDDDSDDEEEKEGAQKDRRTNGVTTEDSDGDDVNGVEVPDAALLDRYPSDETRIDLTHLRLTSKSLRKLGLSRFRDTLEYLGLRQNEISRISSKDIGALKKLKDLDLYDNHIEKLGKALEQCTELESLDLSFNNFRHLPHISHLGKCHTLYFVQNKISRIRPDDFMPPLQTTLRSLELGGNKLRTMENLGDLVNLEELWLGKNKITKLENLNKFSRLRVLSIQSNRITKLENLEKLANLEELYISHNGLTKLEGLEHNSKLTTLDFAGNKVKVIENVNHLSRLEEFWANDNQIDDINHITDHLGPSHMPQLSTIYLEGNPAYRKEGPAYRRKLILSLPQIQQIDAT